MSSYTEDPIYDGPAGINGIDGSGLGNGVYAIYTYSGNLWCGGQFNTFQGSGATCYNLFYVNGYGGGGGSQIYTEAFGGTNGKVNALREANGYMFVGGEFSYVNFLYSPINYPYIATWNGGSWDYVGGNAFNAPVNAISYTPNYPYLFIGGSFTGPFPYACYIDFTFPNNYPTDTTIGLSAPINRGCVFYNGTIYIHTTTQGVYSSSTYQVWTNLGQPYLANPSYIAFWNGEPKVGWSDYEYIQSRSNVSQNASFVLSSGNFKFNGTLYTTATLGLVDIGWDFVGDTAGLWRQTSYNPWGSYS
jgi:hypothetical protein